MPRISTFYGIVIAMNDREHGVPHRDPALFRQVRLDEEMGTVVWPNGADIAPETLYAEAQRRSLTA